MAVMDLRIMTEPRFGFEIGRRILWLAQPGGTPNDFPPSIAILVPVTIAAASLAR